MYFLLYSKKYKLNRLNIIIYYFGPTKSVIPPTVRPCYNQCPMVLSNDASKIIENLFEKSYESSFMTHNNSVFYCLTLYLLF